MSQLDDLDLITNSDQVTLAHKIDANHGRAKDVCLVDSMLQVFSEVILHRHVRVNDAEHCIVTNQRQV